jgi:hypothetical protein
MVIRFFLIAFILILTGCRDEIHVENEGNSVKRDYLKTENIERAVKRLDVASRWMIGNGIMEILTNNNYADKFHRIVIDEFASTFHTKPGLDNEDELARFIIKSYAIHYDINLLKRSFQNDSVYEYWMIFKSSQSLPEYHEDCQFFITQSDSIKSRREIVKESGQFFHQYIEGNEVAISLDYENDMYIRYKLGAWIVPHCYKNYTHITQQKIIPMGPVGSGNYSFAR